MLLHCFFLHQVYCKFLLQFKINEEIYFSADAAEEPPKKTEHLRQEKKVLDLDGFRVCHRAAKLYPTVPSIRRSRVHSSGDEKKKEYRV